MNDIYQVFSNTSDAVFGIDAKNRINFWNNGCEKLLGLPFDSVEGSFCHAVLRGTDLSGVPFCCAKGCHVSKQLKNGGCPSDFDLMVKGSDGNSLWINISSYGVPKDLRKGVGKVGGTIAFFSMRQVNSSRLINRLASEARNLNDDNNGSRYQLSGREIEVLRLASHGVATDKISERLSISLSTVRNHFKKIYSKLDVHCRSEAVALALRCDLL